MDDSENSRTQTRSSAHNITDIPPHVSEPTHSCAAEMLAVFWGSAAVFLLLTGAAVIMYRNGTFSSIGKKKKRGLDTLFELEEPLGPPIRPPERQEWQSSSYAEVMSTDTACHYRRISRSMGSINLRPFNGTMKGSTLYSKMNTQAAVDITISVVPPDFKAYKQSSYWLGTETDFDDVYEWLPKKRATPSRFFVGDRHDIVPGPDEEDAMSEELQGATSIQTQRNTRHVPSKFLYISPVFNGRNQQSTI